MAEHSFTGFRPPAQLDITNGNLCENFRKWKQQLMTFLAATECDAKPKETQTAIVLNLAGDEVIEISNHFVYAEEESGTDPDCVLKKIEEYCTPRKNEVYDSYKFWTTPLSAPIDHFVAELRTKAKNCAFGEMMDRMIRDKIMFSITDTSLKSRLMRENENLTLTRLITIARAHEAALGHLKDMDSTSSTGIVNRLASKPHTNTPARSDRRERDATPKDCHFCDRKHIMEKEQCPAWGKICKKCRKPNHFASKCKTKNLNILENADSNCDSEPDPNSAWIGAIHTNGRRLCAEMHVGSAPVVFQLDSGAEVNTICERHIAKSVKVKPTKQRLMVWNGEQVAPNGEVVIAVMNPKTGQRFKVKFIVVGDNFSNLLGLKALTKMNLITINKTFNVATLSKIDVCQVYSDVFEEKLGCLPGKVSLTLNSDNKPQILPPRKLPIALQDEVKTELDRLCDLGVLTPITEPTEWVNQMAVARKKNNAIRLCIDPRLLNESLLREHYQLPTLEDTLSKFVNAKVFSKLDVSSAYWHLELDHESSIKTAMITPFGRYRWLRLPFGLSVSSEIFQRNLTQALEGLEGVICVADDIVIVGASQAEHDERLHALLKRCSTTGIKLNKSKVEIDCREFVFLGHIINASGIKPDPAKIRAICDMPTPADITDLRRFCGLVQFLSKFIPGLSELAAPLRGLTRKGIEWDWAPAQQKSFEEIKKKVANAQQLRHYDPNAELTLQADASQYGLGAALVQHGQPIAYASRSLTDTESRYAQIEKECLSVVFGLERFDQFTFGRPVRVENDHKPLETILHKPLNAIPKRLQGMMMRMHRYNVQLKYVPGPSMIVADTLSRACVDKPEKGPFDGINALAYLPISDTRITELREATAHDDTSQMLMAVISYGWPEHKELLPDPLTPFFAVRDTLTVHDGIIMKGERLFIPLSMRKDTQMRLHSAHLGKDSMLRRARELIYWPGMSADIIQIAEACEVCQKASPRQAREPLMPHERGEHPFQKAGVDLFSIANRNYMVLVDYLSGFWEVDFLPSTNTSTIIMKLKAHFARHGIPEILISDNAQFVSREFNEFTASWGITLKTSSPGHSQSNGKTESAVKAAKTMMKKCTNSDHYLALLELRNTPVQNLNLSPAQMALSRRTRTCLPSTPEQLKPVAQQPHADLQRKIEIQKRSYDRNATPMKPLETGAPIMFDRFDSTKRRAKWDFGTVIERYCDSPRSYVIEDQSGVKYRRNRVHLKRVPSLPLNVPPDPIVLEDPIVEEKYIPMTTPAQAELQTPPESIKVPDVDTTPRRSHRPRNPPTFLRDYST